MIRFSITPILSDTLAPPRIDTNGCSGASSALPITSISFSIRKPTAEGRILATPTLDACALWLVPKASFTYRSARDASFLANSGSFLVSPATYLVFSIRQTSPSLRFATSSLTLSSTTSGLGKKWNLSL